MLSRRHLLAAVAAGSLPAQERSSGMFADAEAYERFMGRWSRALAPALVKFGGPSGGRVLDAGSGTGSLAFAIAGLNADCSVLGIDPSQEYVEYARSRNPYADRVRFETGDAQRLDLPDRSFDAASSLLVFNFIPDRRKALGELMRVTKPGGRISAAVWDYGAGMRMLRVFWDAAAAVDGSAGQKDESHMPLARRGELGELWKQGGLEAVEEQALEMTTRFASFADYREPFLLGQGPAGAYVRGLDAASRDKLWSEVRRRLAVRSDDAPISLPARAWAVRGAVPR